MTSKERVYAALRRQKPDRVPIFMWFHPITAERLAAELDLPKNLLGVALGDDVRQAWVGNNHAMEGIVHERDGEGHSDDWGIDWVKQGPFNQIAKSPLENAPKEELKNYKFPFSKIDQLLENMNAILPLQDEYFIGCDISPCLFELMCRLRGMEEAIMDLADIDNSVEKIYDEATRFAVELGEAACQRFPMDWFWTGDDVGGQFDLIMNPKIWRQFMKPRLMKIFDVGKKHNLYVAYHACGAIREIIPDLIEMGMDVLNPIQANCPGMDPIELKREFGKYISFMGGVDTVELLPRATAETIFRETKNLIEKMTEDGGGYILSASHTVPPETPLENIFAMYKAAGLSKEEIFDRASELRQDLPRRRREHGGGK